MTRLRVISTMTFEEAAAEEIPPRSKPIRAKRSKTSEEPTET